MLLNLTLSILLSVVGFVTARPLVLFMGAKDGHILSAGTAYLQIQMAGFVFFSLTSTITALLRGIGDSKTAMYYNTVANLVNLILNYLLINGHLGFPRLEVAGASLATTISQIVSCILAVIAISKKSCYIHMNLHDDFRPSRTVEFAAHQVCMNIQSLTMMNGQVFSISSTSLTGQSLGKKRPDMAQAYTTRCKRCGMAIAITLGILFVIFGRPLSGLYTNDATCITLCIQILWIVAFIQPFQSSQFIVAGALRGAGDTKFVAKLTFFTVMLLRPGLALLAINVFSLGLPGAWFAILTVLP